MVIVTPYLCETEILKCKKITWLLTGDSRAAFTPGYSRYVVIQGLSGSASGGRFFALWRLI